MSLTRTFAAVISIWVLGFPVAGGQESPPPPSVSEIPATFTPKTDTFDYVRREEMVAMRDGVKLKTIVLVPKAAQGAPILLARTPYNAAERMARTKSSRLLSVAPQMMDTSIEAGYIVAYQDVRGKHGSEGDYVMNRPLRGPLNATETDHATDTYDTIEWLVRNIPESNGRVATIGGSYEGFTALMSTVQPASGASRPPCRLRRWWTAGWATTGSTTAHSAPRARSSSPTTSRRRAAAPRSGGATRTIPTRPGCAAVRPAPSRPRAGSSRRASGASSPRTRPMTPGGRSRQWTACSRKNRSAVPMLIVGGLFDQEDIYGAPALYKALAPKDPEGRFVHLVLGPWNHGQSRREGRGIGMVQFEGDTAAWFRREVMQPFLDHYLKDAPETRYAARAGLRDGRQRLAPLRRLAARLRRGLRREEPGSLPARGRRPRVRAACGGEGRLRRIPVRSRKARAVSPAADDLHRRRGLHLGRVAHGRPAPARRRGPTSWSTRRRR